MVQLLKILSSYQCFDELPGEKCTENLVERMLKININVFNCKNENATTRPMISQNFRTFQKMRISEKFSKKYRNFEFYKRERSAVYRMERHSTSPPCGNLVDGLPHDCHWPDPGPAKIRNFGRHFHVISDLLYHELLVCYIQILFIILKFNFL